MSAVTPSPIWRFLVDENLPRSLASELAALGYTATHIHDLGMGGAKDLAVYAYTQSQSATLITGDKDFSDIRAYPPPHSGIVIVEVPDTMPPAARNQLVLRQLATLSGQSLESALVIIAPGRVRVRHLLP